MTVLASLQLVARYCPGFPLVSPAWDTPDHSMPWHLALALIADLPRIMAMGTLTDLRVPLIASGSDAAQQLLHSVHEQAFE
jgi:hypothetical protein